MFAGRGLGGIKAIFTSGAGAGYTTATTGSEVDRGSTYSENQYQCDIRCDPADPGNRQCISMKTGSASTTVRFIWTTDGWSTRNTVTYSGGDPDSAWDNNGDLFLSYMGTSATEVRKVAGGGSTVGSAFSFSYLLDHPHIWVNRATNRLFLAGRRFVGGLFGIVVGYSDDGAATWTQNLSSVNAAVDEGFVFPGVCLSTGTTLIPVAGKRTVLTSGGVYAGTTQQAYVLRSTNSGATLASTQVAVLNNPASRGAGGYQHVSNLAHADGRTYLFFIHASASPSPCELRFVYSDDDGVTWSSEQTAIGAPESGYGPGSMWVAARDGLLVVTFHALQAGGYEFKIWQMWSADKGATWSSPYTLSGFNYDYTGNPRVPGQDQVIGDFHGSTAYTVWQDNRSNAGKYIIYTRNTVFS